MWSRLRRVTDYALRCVCFISFVSLAGWIPFIFIEAALRQHFNRVEFPLRAIQDVVVDSKDRVYVGIDRWARVNVYDRRGRFLFSFHGTHNWRSKMGFADDGSLLLARGRGDEILIFNDRGERIGTRTGSREILRKWKQGRPWTWSHDSQGREFQIRHPVINPKIVTVLPDGSEQVFLATPWYLWPFMAGYPCLISVVITTIVYRILQRWSDDESVEKGEITVRDFARDRAKPL